MTLGIWVGFLIGGVLWAILFGPPKLGRDQIADNMDGSSRCRECVWCDRNIDLPARACSGMDEGDLYELSDNHTDALCRQTLTDLDYTVEWALANGHMRPAGPSKDDST